MWWVGNVFYEPCPHGWPNPGSTGSVSDQCEVVRPWWGSEPFITLFLGQKGEVPVGREQKMGRCVPTYKCHCALLIHLSPWVRDPLGKGGSHWLLEPTASGQSRGTKCIFHAWISLIHSLSNNPANTAFMSLSSPSIYLETQAGGGKSGFQPGQKNPIACFLLHSKNGIFRKKSEYQNIQAKK